MHKIKLIASLTLLGFIGSAGAQSKAVKGFNVDAKLAEYKTIRLTADLSKLTEKEKKALAYMIKAARYADSIFWKQAFGNPDTFLARITDEKLRQFASINYGPWDRMDNDKPFIAGYGPKPLGARFYPADIRKGEYDSMETMLKADPYTVIRRRNDHEGMQGFPEPPPGMEPPYDPNGVLLEFRPYQMVYQFYVMQMGQYLLRASEELGAKEDPLLFDYLRQRGEGLMNNTFMNSDIAWLKLTKSSLDIIIGPIENYEDKLFGVKTAFEAYVLVRDKEWGAKLEKYISLLPDLQKNLPVDSAYKTEEVGNGKSQLAVFDAVFYAGDCNAGSKTIAVNLPNDENLQKDHGTRRTQIRNVMRAKFDNMVLPITNLVIDPSQRSFVNFDAFFNDVMFHEVAHGLGIKNTITGMGTVREALGATYSAIEECKADVLGLWMVTKMVEKEELKGKLDEYYVTFVASVFRSVRFGAGNSHGQANMITFNTLLDNGAISRDSKGLYKVNVPKMKEVITKLAGELLMLQGNGNAAEVKTYIENKAVVGANLNADLKSIGAAGIPVDLIFEQGEDVLGLPKD